MLRKTTAVVFLVIAFALSMQAQSNFVLKGDIRHFKRPAQIYLLAVKGSTWDMVDSVYSKDGKFQFSYDTIPHTGEYHIQWEDEYFLSLIIHGESLIEFTADNLEDDFAVHVINSEENKAYYFLRGIEQQVDSLTALGDYFYSKKMNGELQQIRFQLHEKVAELEQMVDSLYNAKPGLFSVKMYKNGLPPDFKEFSEKNPEHGYTDEYAFLKRHYFDSIDKHDSSLVNTRLLYDACSFYLRNFSDKKTVEDYIRSCDFIISTFSFDNAQYNYVIDLLLNTFEAAGYEEVFLHIYETYLKFSSCEGGIPDEHERMALSIKNLKKGSPAPELSALDRNGNTVSLGDFRGKTVVVMFWESSCFHCREAIPAVLKLLKERPEIVFLSFSIDQDENKWIGGLLQEELPEPSISDLQGYDGPNAIRWCVSGTPTFFVIDKDGKIAAKPMTLSALESALQ